MIHRILPWIALVLAVALFVALVWDAKAEVPARVQRWLPDVAHHVQAIWGHKRLVALHGALIERESAGRPDVSSPAGATGLVQIMPGTFRELRGQYPGFGSDPRNPQTSMALGFRYLRKMHVMHQRTAGSDCDNWRRALASYNCGPGCVARRIRQHGAAWLSHVPRETRHYVPAILGREPAFIRHGWPGVAICATCF